MESKKFFFMAPMIKGLPYVPISVVSYICILYTMGIHFSVVFWVLYHIISGHLKPSFFIVLGSKDRHYYVSNNDSEVEKIAWRWRLSFHLRSGKPPLSMEPWEEE